MYPSAELYIHLCSARDQVFKKNLFHYRSHTLLVSGYNILEWARETGCPRADLTLPRSCVEGESYMTLEIMAGQAGGTLGHSGDGERAACVANVDLQANEGSEADHVTTVHTPHHPGINLQTRAISHRSTGRSARQCGSASPCPGWRKQCLRSQCQSACV